jgi:hypothetical protein
VLDGEHEGARAPPGFARAELDGDAFALQKVEHKIADQIIADSGQERSTQAETACADTDVRWRAADVAAKLLISVKGAPISLA